MLDWEPWARQRAWLFHRGWPTILTRFRGGGLGDGVMREVPQAFEGRFGEYPCFGFSATAGSDPWGGYDVVALRVPGAQFPPLTVVPVVATLRGPHVDIGTDFDLEWQAGSPSTAFARDVLVDEVLPALRLVEFEYLWFEQDAILLSTRRELDPQSIDEALTALHRVVDAIPVKVLAAVGAGRALPVSRPPTVRPGPVARQRFQFGTSTEAWRTWTAQRQWVFTTAKDIHSRLKFRIPVAPDGHGFVGKFGDLPVFGFPAAPLRNVVGVRIPGVTLPEITMHKDDQLLAELIGQDGFEVGDRAFDYVWRIQTADPSAARQTLRPQVRACFEEAPPFDRLWFGGDSIALITTQAIAPGAVDGLLTWLLSIAGSLPLHLADSSVPDEPVPTPTKEEPTP